MNGAQMNRFTVKYNSEFERYDVLNEDGIALDSYHTKPEAEAEATRLNHCEHIFLEPPEWYGSSGLSQKIRILCRDCGQEAIIPLPSNLEWS